MAKPSTDKAYFSKQNTLQGCSPQPTSMVHPCEAMGYGTEDATFSSC